MAGESRKKMQLRRSTATTNGQLENLDIWTSRQRIRMPMHSRPHSLPRLSPSLPPSASLPPSLTHSLTLSLSHPLARSLTHSPPFATHSHTHPFYHSLTHPPTHSHTHSFVDPNLSVFLCTSKETWKHKRRASWLHNPVQEDERE